MKYSDIRKAHLFLLIIFFIGGSSSLVAQQDVVKNKEGRFMGKVDSGAYVEDRAGLMKNYTLSIQWWTLLGQAVEFYGIKWETTGQYEINLDGKPHQIKRQNLVKYPDLLKRFDDLRPSKLGLVVSGDASGKRIEVRSGKGFPNRDFYAEALNSAKKREGKVYRRYTLRGSIVYEVTDQKLFYTRAGQQGEDLLPRSPRNWNEFLIWSNSGGNLMNPASVSSLNKKKPDYARLSKERQTGLEKNLKHLFDNATSFSLKVRIKNLEWPTTELEMIATLFKEYEEGSKKPPPLQEVVERMDEVNQLPAYTGDDEWASAETIDADGFEIKTVDGKQGVINKQTGQALIPFRNWKILDYRSKSAQVKITNYRDATGIPCMVKHDDRRHSVRIEEHLVGRVDTKGEWEGVPPKKSVLIYGGHSEPIGLYFYAKSVTAEQIRRVEQRKKRQAKECNERMRNRVQALKSEYRNKGYIIE